MATDRPQGDPVRCRMNTKHIRLGKANEMSSLDKITPILLMTAVEFEPTTSHSLCGGTTSRLTHCFNHSPTED